MDSIKQFIRYIIKGLPLVAIIILSTLIAFHVAEVLPPLGIILVFISVIILTSAAVGIARDIIENG